MWLRVLGMVLAVLSLALVVLVRHEAKWVPVLRWSMVLRATTTVLRLLLTASTGLAEATGIVSGPQGRHAAAVASASSLRACES